MRVKWVLITICLAFIPHVSAADYLEVRRNANVYKEPDRKSEIITLIELSEHNSPYMVRLLEDTKVNGYYKIHVPGKSVEGWVYKTLVRRYRGQHPKYQLYKRTLYVHWIDEDHDCQNTRAEALIRDDDDHVVEFKTEKECLVTHGTWLDPYTGKTFHNARKVDVDHVVPLKNAHESGGWAWSKERRRKYANYLLYNKHLLAVSATENRRKGAKGPDQYLPPLESYHCEYVKIWIRIKKDWELEMSESEEETIESVLANCN